MSSLFTFTPAYLYYLELVGISLLDFIAMKFLFHKFRKPVRGMNLKHLFEEIF
jgi:hypothetical protein